MKVDVVRKATFKLNDSELLKFKEAVAEHLCKESDDENCCYSATDVPDAIAEKVLKDAIRAAYEEGYDPGFSFDDYFETVSINLGEDSTADAVYEACALFWDAQSENHD